jgi:hypothetical protein
MEAQSPVKQRWQSDHLRVVCGLATSRCPHPVLCKEVAEQVLFARECRVRGRGSHVHHPRPSLPLEEPERVANQRAGIRDAGLGAEARSLTPHLSSTSTPASGSSPQRPVRLQARPLRSITCGETYPDQKRCRVLTCHRRRAPMYGPGPSKLCPCHVFALSAPDTSAPPDYCAGTGQRLRRRPT